jgi:hypothetical protein
MGFSFFEQIIIGQEKPGSEAYKKQSSEDKAQIRIEKPAGDQYRDDQQAKIDNAQVVFLKSLLQVNNAEYQGCEVDKGHRSPVKVTDEKNKNKQGGKPGFRRDLAPG